MQTHTFSPPDFQYGQTSPAAKRPKLGGNGPDPAQSAVRYISSPYNYPRKRTAIACEICRVRKSRCDSGKPSCGSCVQLGVACSYRTTAVGNRPGQDAAEIFLSNLDTRLDRIETLLDQNCRPQLNSSHAAASSDTPTAHTPGYTPHGYVAGVSSYPTPSSPGFSTPPHPTQSNFLGFEQIGLSFECFTRLAGHDISSTLKPLQFDETEAYLDREIVQGRQLFQAGDPDALDLSPRLCWRLHQSFARNILPWFPLFDPETFSKLAAKQLNYGFDRHDPEAGLILFMLGLGALSKAEDLTSDSPHDFSGLNYFLAACRILTLNTAQRYSLVEVQCQILMSLYLLLCLRPLQASHAISQASRSLLTLLNLRSRIDSDAQLRESSHRAYWVCFIVEHELKVHVSYGTQPLTAIHEAIPLPLSHYDEPSMFWFLAGISMRRLYTFALADIWKESCFVYAPMVLEVLRQQISQWYDGLPPNIKFPEDTTSLLDPQKAFLRTQYFALRWVITWPAVVRILTKEPDDENQHAELLRFSSEALHYLIAHVLSAESLLQERHQMLFANLLGTYYSTMILLTIYHAPILDFVRTPATRAAICKGHAMLSIWAANPGVASNIRRIEEQMIRCGLLQTKGPAAISPASTTTPTTITTTTTTTTKSTASTTTSVPPEAVHQQSTVSGYQHQNNRLGPGASAEQVPLARTRMGLEDVMEPVLGPNPIKPAQNDVHTNQNAKVEYSAAQY